VADRADLVVVGAGTIGGWASVFAKADGASRVIVVERGLAGLGASSRAAGIVRAQGGTPATVALGRWTIVFYNGQQAAYGTDSGFRELGYLILAVTEEDERAGRERVAMQRANGLDVTWLDASAAAAVGVTLSPDGHRGGSYVATDGAIDPPRNVRAYSLAMQAAGVELREQTTFTGLRTEPARDGGGSRVVAVETDAGTIETERVLLTGGPGLRAVGRAAGLRIPAGAARHTVAVLEPHPVFDVPRMPMVFDIGDGLYWRLEEGGLLFGWSDPDERPGEAREIDWAAYDRARARLAGFVPVTRELGLRRIWAATIDYTPDHLPIIGPGVTPDGGPIEGVTVASAGGHGMMWGPGVARVAADLVTRGRTELIDISDLGLDRFDAEGRSRLASDPIALPFPVSAE
jgi:glycine/D-amino acid oxidase-like deaminating enzyme